MLVTLGDVLFGFGRADIKPTAQVSLRKLADFLQQYPDRSLLIEGHTDTERALNRRVEVYITRSEEPVRQRG